MPVWLLSLLSKFGLPILKAIWHAITRFWSVFLVGLVILTILMKFHAIKLDQYNIGYKAGYSQALTDHPQTVGTIYNNQGKVFKWLGVDLELLGIQIKAGH
jgi:hypothetical protein